MMSSLSVEEMCKKLKPVYGNKIDKLYVKYALSTNLDERKQIEQIIIAMFYKNMDSLLNDQIILETPEKSKISGEYELGHVMYGNKIVDSFGLREEDWIRHLCISGMSGSGKTNFALIILRQLIKHKKPFLVFDWKKSFRHLMKDDNEVLCFTIGNPKITNLFKININKPPKGVMPREWLTILCDLITESFAASFGVHKVLSEILDQAFHDFGVYEGSGNYPTWKQIKDRIEDKAEELKRSKSRENEWLTSALRIAHALTFGEFSEVINHKENPLINLEDLLDKKVIFELNTLGSTEKKFFCEYILTYIYKFRKANMLNSLNEFKHAILVDEAHNIFLKNKPSFVSETVTEMIYREIREFGTSLICLDQHISKLSDVVAGNSACNIAMQQMLHYDLETISGLMLMKHNKKYFSMLPVGCAIVKLAERYYNPFLIKIDKIETELVDDLQVKQKVKMRLEMLEKIEKFEKGVDVKALVKEFNHVDKIMYDSGTNTDNVQKEFLDIMNQVLRYKNTSFVNKEKSLSLQQKQFINFLRKYPNLGTSKVYKALGLSARKGNRLKKELIDQQVIREEIIVDNTGWRKIMKPTVESPENLGKQAA